MKEYLAAMSNDGTWVDAYEGNIFVNDILQLAHGSVFLYSFFCDSHPQQ